MRIAYTTQYNPEDINQWSGTVKHIADSLEAESFKVSKIGPLRERNASIYKVKQLWYKQVLKKGYLRNREKQILTGYAKQISKRLNDISCDVVFSPETLAIAHLECKQPMVFWADSTFAGMVNFYPKFFNLDRKTLESGHAVDKLVLEKSRLAIYSSDWAAKSAIDHYQVNQNKVKVVPFGANIYCDRTLGDIKTLIRRKSTNRCKLLFLGVDWYRKGGDIALQVAKTLNLQGLATELTVVGCQPDTSHPLPDYVNSLGFINKSSSKGLETINRLLSEAHFLILPSRAECFGIVFCEASSFGLPSLSTNIGGIPTVVQDDLNGKVFPLQASANEYCEYIHNLFSNYSNYEALALSSFDEYQSRLNWSVAGKTVRNLLSEL